MGTAALDPTVPRRWRIDDRGTDFVITIPRKFSAFIFLYPLFLAPFLYGFLTSAQPLGPLFSIFAALLVAFTFYEWLWNLDGAEVVTINNEEVCIEYELFGLAWPRTTQFANVEGFIWEQRVYSRNGHPSRIALVRRDDTFFLFSRIRFADYISQSEADELLDAIHNRFPGLRNLDRRDSFGLI